MWKARQLSRLDDLDHDHARHLAMSAPKIDVCTCASKEVQVSSWKSRDILDGPLVLAGPIDGESLSNYTSSLAMKRNLDSIESLLFNDGRITPTNSFSEESASMSNMALLRVDSTQRQQTPKTRPKCITPSPSFYPNLTTNLILPALQNMSGLAPDPLSFPVSQEASKNQTIARAERVEDINTSVGRGFCSDAPDQNLVVTRRLILGYDAVDKSRCVTNREEQEEPEPMLPKVTGKLNSNAYTTTPSWASSLSIPRKVIPCTSCLSSNNPVSDSAAGKSKKRSRALKLEPTEKTYVPVDQVTDTDILFGKGGRSNAHPGNNAYRLTLLRYQPLYKTLDDDRKKKLSKDLVEAFKINGRFLKNEDPQDKDPQTKGPKNKRPKEKRDVRYYIATDDQARGKVSQNLREDHTPDGRQQKKSRQKTGNRS